MKKLPLLIIAVLLSSCKKQDDTPKVETTTVGVKWNLQIGNSYADVYTSLQQLGVEKGFTDLAVVKQQPFINVQDIQGRLKAYQGITIETSTGTLNRAIISFPADKVKSIEVGGALPTEVAKWPQEATDDVAIKKDDPIDALYAKLASIMKMPAYQDYHIVLPNKLLSKPFDPAMANYNEWGFDFFVNTGKASRSGRYDVRLFFKNGKLSKIESTYTEYDVYYTVYN